MSQDRTEAPTPKRLRELSARGSSGRSTELTSSLALFVAVVALAQVGPIAVRQAAAGLQSSLGAVTQSDLTPGTLAGVWVPLEPGVMSIFGGVLVPVALVSLVVGLFQIRGRLSPAIISPKPSRLNPINGMKHLFSTDALVGLIWPLLKLAVVAFAVQGTVRGMIGTLPSTVSGGPAAEMSALGAGAMDVARNGAGALVLLALVDVLYRRRQFMNQARMSRQELKEETRQSEGDPMVRARLKALRRKLAQRRMLHQVPKARVVVVNPTHFAVALAYEPKKMAAPLVVAKGADLLAQKIIEIAREHRVPIVPNPPIARSLYKSVEIGDPIPVALYEAIADILAYVYSLRRRR